MYGSVFLCTMMVGVVCELVGCVYVSHRLAG